MKQFLGKRNGLGFSILVGILLGITMAVIFAAGFFFRDLNGYVFEVVEAQSGDRLDPREMAPSVLTAK